MKIPRTSHAAAFVAACLALPAGPAVAQTFIQQSATPDADALASEMRLLAANPNDLNAMIRAGELTLKLDDATAAAGFFARAERIDPSNPRIKAGKGTLLVQAGRPGEALRLYNEAELLRGDVRAFAADRGLAYDLIGEQERAQRDYRLALKNGPADETLRRYALSLGISGKQAEALEVIDPLLRRSDRGAWRARAFILAMNGDARGAERIAASMMPGGLGQGLQPFFDRLPRLPAADRAFAVHFGEVRPTPQRLADARMTPRLPVLQPEPGRVPVALAAVATVQQPVRETSRSRRDRRKREKDRVVLATIVPPAPLPQPPGYQAPNYQTPSVSIASTPTYTPPLPATGGRTYAVPKTVPPVALASNRAINPAQLGRNDVAPMARGTDPYRSAAVALSDVPVRAVPPAARAADVTTARPQIVEAVPVPVPVQLATATQPKLTTPTPAPVGQSAPVQVASVAAAPIVTAAPALVAATPAAVAAATPAMLPPAPGPAKGEDSILARIIANITVPGSELDVAGEPAAAPASVAAVSQAPAAIVVDDAQTTLIAEQKAADRLANDKVVADRKAAEKRAADRKLAEAKAAADAPADDAASPVLRKPGETKRAFDARKLAAAKADEAEAAALVRKPGETKRAFDARKLAATKAAGDDDKPAMGRKPGETARQFEARKLAASRAAPDDDGPDLKRKPGETVRQFEARKLAAAKKGGTDKKEPKTAEPARIWVQVAGGANEGDLAKAWDKVRKDAPLAMRGRVAWTTPLRATNRVLTGPFKTDGEARTLVNALGKEGVSAFAFTSEAGQKVVRLAGK